MPFVRIDVVEGSSARYQVQISDAVHQALVERFNVPAADRFQAISVHALAELSYPAEYLGIAHTSAIVIIQITCNEGRTVELKKALYARIAELIASSTEIPPSDVIISLVEVKKENWSFGNGMAQYA
jgi:4-oxalocrotonate tautomerase